MLRSFFKILENKKKMTKSTNSFEMKTGKATWLFETIIFIGNFSFSGGNLVQQWSSYAPSIVTILMQIDAQSEILWDFEFFEKSLW